MGDGITRGKTAVFLGVIICMVLSGGILAAVFLSVPGAEEFDMVEVNHILKTAEQIIAGSTGNIAETSAAETCFAETCFAETCFAYPFVILDSGGTPLYMSEPGLPDSVHELVRKGFVSLDITGNGIYRGRLFIGNTLTEDIAKIRQRYAAILIIAFSVMAVFLLLFIVLLRRRLIAPFLRLRSFARHITMGRFDIPLPMDRYNMFGAFTESFDIMRESLREARKNEQAAARSKQELTAALAHDIKTPVTSIRLLCELVRCELVRTAAEDTFISGKLALIEEKALQIDRLTNNLLHSALEELEQLSVTLCDRESGVMAELLRNADIGDVNTEGRVRCGSIPECLISIDPFRMEQVINNIIANSYKYAGTAITAEFSLADGFLITDIADEGPGAAEEEIPRLCDKFFRGSCGTSSASGSGTSGEGLGLYIAKMLMNRMGGELECCNRESGSGPGGFMVRLFIRLS